MCVGVGMYMYLHYHITSETATNPDSFIAEESFEIGRSPVI